MNIVQLRDTPPINDLPGQLRQLADAIDKGEVEAASAICIVSQEAAMPILYGWGPQSDRTSTIGLLELAKAWFIRQHQD